MSHLIVIVMFPRVRSYEFFVKSGGWSIFVTMKKWILIAAALLGSLAAQAQVNNRYYVGGNISLGASNYGTSVVFYPEVGKRINDYLMVGLAAGFDWNNIASESDFTMGLIPHVRGYLPVYQRFGLTGDTYFSARWTRRRGYEPLIATQTLGFRPGIYFPIGNVTISTQIGFFGWSRIDDGNKKPSSGWQARLEARDIIFGVLLNL